MAQIQYHIIMPSTTDEQVSNFQGFNESLFSIDFEKLLLAMCCAPNDTAELFMNQTQLLSHRLNGPAKSATTIGIDSTELYLQHVDYPLNVCFCLPEDIEKLVEITSKLTYKPILISTINYPGVININQTNELSCHILDSILYDKVKHLTKATVEAVKLRHLKLRKKYNKPHSTPHRHSNITLPNDIIALSLGYRLIPGSPINATDPQNYIDAILTSAQAVQAILDKTVSNKKNIILFAPSIYGTLYDFNKNRWNQLLRNIKTPWHRTFIKEGFFRNKHYSGINIDASRIKNFEEENPYKDPIVNAIIYERTSELRLTALAISCLASMELKTAIRLPNSINLHQTKLKQIENAFQKDDMKSKALAQSKFRELSDAFKIDIGNDIISFITSTSNSCTICSDSPVEWAYFGSLPLMISHEVSRLPMTPGNTLLQHSTLGNGKTITQSSLHDILILRSFASNDPIKNLLESSIEHFNISENTKVKFADVTSVEDVIRELNDFSSSIVIFDCHGNHDGIDGHGWLHIGDERLNTWELAYKARVPPVVLLSACSTSSINGSHVSVAHGLLRSGALSVIGTYLPVNAFNSASFISRIILRIDVLMPVIENRGISILSWGDFIGAFYKMSYSTDILLFFLKRGNITLDQYSKIHMSANLDINTYKTSWYDNIIESTAKAAKLSSKELLEIIMKETPLTETMLYCHMGRPDLLIIDVMNASE